MHALTRLTAIACCAASFLAHAQPMPDVVRAYRTDSGYLARFYNVDWSDTRRNRLAALDSEWLARLDAMNLDALSLSDRIDWALLHNYLVHADAQRQLEIQRMSEMDALLPFRAPIQKLELDRRHLEPCDPKTAAGILAAVPDQVKAVRERLENARKEAKTPAKPQDGPSEHPAAEVSPPPPPPRSAAAALRTAGVIDEILSNLSEWAQFHDGFQPDFSWWVRQPREAAEKSLRDLATYLRETIAGVKGEPQDPLVGDPIGERALLADLAEEMIAYSPAELITIAQREFAWCEAEMKKCSQEMGKADDWKSALASVKQDYMPPGEQPDLVTAEARRAIAFLKEHDLVTIPPLCEEAWRVEMLSPAAQKSLPFAVYGGQHVGVAYPTDTMSHEDKLMSMRGNNRHFIHIVTPHELIPGHHLQGYFAQRFNDHRQMFSTPFLVEGWALYWEMQLWDLSWSTTPEDRMGMLFWRMHRCARIIVSLKFHLGEMTPQQMIDFLVDRVGHERFGATSEVRRFIGGSYSPLYQCGYMIGGLQLRALHHDLVASGKMSDKQFNDAVLTYGPIPIEFIRAGLTRTPPARDCKPTWRFADPSPAP